MPLKTCFFEIDSLSERTRAFERTRAAVKRTQTSTPPPALETHTESAFQLSRCSRSEAGAAQRFRSVRGEFENLSGGRDSYFSTPSPPHQSEALRAIFPLRPAGWFMVEAEEPVRNQGLASVARPPPLLPPPLRFTSHHLIIVPLPATLQRHRPDTHQVVFLDRISGLRDTSFKDKENTTLARPSGA